MMSKNQSEPDEFQEDQGSITAYYAREDELIRINDMLNETTFEDLNYNPQGLTQPARRENESFVDTNNWMKRCADNYRRQSS